MPEKQKSSDDVLYIEDNKRFRNVEFEDALEYTGFGTYNIILILVCGLTLFGVNLEAYAIGYVLPSAECDLQLNTYLKGILTSSSFIGFTSTCCIWGYLSDIKGRKLFLVANLIMGSICSVLAVFISSFWGFTILKLFNGMFLAGPTAIVYVYFGEFQSKLYKSTGIAWISLFIAFAFLFLPGLGWGLLPQNINFYIFGLNFSSWRIFMLIACLPNLLAALAFLKLPESPKFMFYSGRPEESLHILKEMYSMNTKKPQDTFPVVSLEEKIFDIEDTTTKKAMVFRNFLKQVTALFLPPYLKFSLVASILQAGAFAVSSGIFLWYPDIINQLAAANGENDTVCELVSSVRKSTNSLRDLCDDTIIDNQVFIQNIVIGLTYLIGYLMWASIVKWIGNRNVFVICMGISSASLLLLVFLSKRVLIDTAFILALSLPGITVGVITSLLVDVIPTHLCGMAVCLGMASGRIGSVVSSTLFGIILETSCSLTFSIYSVGLLVCLFLVYVFPKEAR